MSSIADVPKSGDPADAVRLYIMPGRIGTAINPSPFSTKLLTFLRLAGIEYEVVKCNIGTNNNPRKLWPYMMHGSTMVPDSSCIARYLAATYPEAAGRLFPEDPRQKGICHAVSRMCDEAMFPILLWYRFLDPANIVNTEQSYFGHMPWVARKMILRVLLPRVAQRLHLQGVTRNSEADMMLMLKEDLAAASGILGDGPYLLGALPCYADATLLGVLDTGLHDGAPNPCVSDAIKEHPNLVEYAARLRRELFRDKPEEGAAAGAAAEGEAEAGAAAANGAANGAGAEGGEEAGKAAE